MTFVYKIYSGYDGFSPRRIPTRLIDGKCLQLGWDRYIDAVEIGNEVWVYFHGPHAFTNGVYVKGFIRSIAADRRSLLLRVRTYRTDTPLTDAETGMRIAAVVQPQFRQVFLLPQGWEATPACTVGSTAQSCGRHECPQCPAWQALPLIQPADLATPKRLPIGLAAFVPAYWIIPSRCYLRRHVGPEVRRTSNIFYRFKIGEKALAYPLALGIFRALSGRELLDFDAIVPIPLSPEKRARGEIHRTLLLAHELSKLLDVPVLEALRLQRPFSKKAAIAMRATPREFEEAYRAAVTIPDGMQIPHHVLLVDDVCTRGSTLRSARLKLLEHNPQCQITASTAGQMILKDVVVNATALLAP